MFLSRLRRPGLLGIRRFGNIQVPFQDDLTRASDDDFNLADFQHYNPDKDTESKPTQKGIQKSTKPLESSDTYESSDSLVTDSFSLATAAVSEEPAVFESRFSDPYRNLAIEDYIFNHMPVPTKARPSHRLMFYTNSPCVVVGKNQNPWKEVNVPLLNSLSIPLVRRKSGGGTVVHDGGNVNFSFMSSKNTFDRFTFAELVVRAVNDHGKVVLKTNERGDIVTEDNYKVSGSAYKLAKGKSYHHGTMLLSLKLDVLRQLLRRDDKKQGVVDSMNSVQSVKSKVTNIGLKNSEFVRVVTEEFERQYGEKNRNTEENSVATESDEIDSDTEFNELFGLTDFVDANQAVPTFVVDESVELPEEILATERELKQWSWRYGATPKFSHTLTNEKLGFTVTFFVEKPAVVKDFKLEFHNSMMEEEIESSFLFLRQMVDKGDFKYEGSNIAGFITNDMVSDWIGKSIDGTY